MPLVKLSLSDALDDNAKADLLKRLSHIVVESTGKPEQYVMVLLETGSILMAGQPGNAAFADVRGIGLGEQGIALLSKKICDLLNETLHVPTTRTYLNFTNVPASHWGWDGDTFG